LNAEALDGVSGDRGVAEAAHVGAQFVDLGGSAGRSVDCGAQALAVELFGPQLHARADGLEPRRVGELVDVGGCELLHAEPVDVRPVGVRGSEGHIDQRAVIAGSGHPALSPPLVDARTGEYILSSNAIGVGLRYDQIHLDTGAREADHCLLRHIEPSRPQALLQW
jgi:hypothetical protein